MAIKIGNHGREEMSSTTMVAIRKTTESNQLRLQTLELAVAHLTNICIGLSEEVRSLRSTLLEPNKTRGAASEAVIEMKLPYYSNSNSSSLSSESKDDLGAKKVKRQPWKKDAKIIPVIKVQAAGRKPHGQIKAVAKTSRKGSSGSTKPEKARPAMATMGAKPSEQVKTESRRMFEREGLKKPARKANDAKPLPLNAEEGGRTGSKNITVELPPQMADSPTIRSLIFGSRNVSAVKSSGMR